MAAAIGAGLPVSEPTGNMIVDIGGGTTEVAVISLGGIVVSQSIRVGGDEMDEAIMGHIKKEYKLLIGQQTAEELKLEIGSAWDLKDEVRAEVRGRDMLTGLPKTIVITSEEVRRALDEPVTQIIDAIKSTLDKTPPELAADIMDRGIVLAGGGALLSGLDMRLREETLMPVHLAESPAHLRRGRLGPQPRGVRGDPPLRQGPAAKRKAPVLTARWPHGRAAHRYLRLPGRPVARPLDSDLRASATHSTAPRPELLPSAPRRRPRPERRAAASAAGRARPRARLAGADHGLLPRVLGGRRAPRRPAHRRQHPDAVRGRRRARRAPLPGRLGLGLRPRRREGRERAPPGRGQAIPGAGDREARPPKRSSSSSRDQLDVHRRPELPVRLHGRTDRGDRPARRASSPSRSRSRPAPPTASGSTIRS